METKIIGHTVQKKPIQAFFWSDSRTQNSSDRGLKKNVIASKQDISKLSGTSQTTTLSPTILMLGGVHGDETEGVTACLGVLNELFGKQNPYKFNFILIPCLNLDGLFAKTRQNANGVDLNRNLNTKDWSSEFTKFRYYPGKAPLSEPENQALMKILDEQNFAFIFTLHSWKPMLNTNGDCRLIEDVLHQETGYRIVPDIGYPTPGSLGALGAIDRGIPTLTYELEKGMEQEEIMKIHVPALMKALKACEQRFC